MHHFHVSPILSHYFYITNTSIKPADVGREITHFKQKHSCQARNQTTFLTFWNVVPTVQYIEIVLEAQPLVSLMSINITMQIRHLLHSIWQFMIVFSLSTILNSPDMNNL